MRGFPLLLVLSFGMLLAAAAPAQIFEVVFVDEDAAEKYEDEMVEVGGKLRFLGEIKSGVTYEPGVRTNYDPKQRSEWYIPDPDDPSSLPYRVEDGIIEKDNRKQVAGVQNRHIKAIRVWAPNGSWYAIGREWEQREARLERLEEARDKHDKGGGAWQAAHRRLLDEYDQSATWLRTLGFTGKAEDIEKDMKREERVVGREAALAREKAAMAGIGDVAPAEEVTASAAEWANGLQFKQQQSQHCRIVYHDGIADGTVEAALKMAEKAILGFRARFVDPYLADDFVDRIPDHVFVEWYFGPDDIAAHDAMYTKHYGFSWGPRKEEKLKMQGSRVQRHDGENAVWFYYWRNGDEGISGKVANNLGVTLATIHYGTADARQSMDWLEEALGYWVSLEYLGRNNVTNKAFDWRRDDEERTVAGGGKKDDERKTVAEGVVQPGERQLYLESALREGMAFQALMTTRLFDMERGDVAKSWAMFEFLTQQHPERAQHFLRAMTQHARVGVDFHQKLRTDANALFEVQGRDVFRELDRWWEEWVRAQLGIDED